MCLCYLVRTNHHGAGAIDEPAATGHLPAGVFDSAKRSGPGDTGSDGDQADEEDQGVAAQAGHQQLEGNFKARFSFKEKLPLNESIA